MGENKRINVLTNFFKSQTAIDLALATLVWGSVLMVWGITQRPLRQSFIFALCTIGATVWMFIRKGLYTQAPALPRTEEISRVFIGTTTGAATVTIVASFTDWSLGAAEILIGAVGLFLLRILVRGLLKSLSTEYAPDRSEQRVTIVGAGHEASELVQLIKDHPELKLHFCGVVGNLAVAERNGIADEWIGPTSRLVEIMRRYNIDSAIITTTGFRGERFKQIAKELFSAGFDVHLTTGVGRMWEGRFEVKSLVHEPFITVGRNVLPKWQLAAKRSIDIIGATLALIAASPILLVVSAAIYISDKGPVLYTSRRIGTNADEFAMYKFRSMVQNADKLKAQMESENERSGPLFKVSHDPRITRVGRFIRETSIDELPQLINVLLGHMSLVGPRPALPEETLSFDDELQKRTEVRPGITGLWQVEARSNAAFNAYRRLDLHYVENWNIWLDIRILLATAEQVAVSIAMIPFKKIFGAGESVDAVAATAEDTTRIMKPFTVEEIIDLRDSTQSTVEASETQA